MRTALAYSYRRILVASAILFMCWNGLFWDATASTNPGDLKALQELRDAWGGANDSLVSWTGNDPCGDQWTGVECTSGSAVTELNLPGLKLVGSIAPAIGDLVSLQKLDLSFNQLTGSLPEQLGNLRRLTQLRITNAGVRGTIPEELGQCVALEYLALNDNGLSGSLPASLGNLVQLTWFDISMNALSGPLPVSTTPGSDGVGIDNLVECIHFHFNNNSFTGNIPSEIFNLPNLLHMLLDGNNFQGSLPRNVRNATGLGILRLSSNRLSLDIPAELNELSGLSELHLANNSFSGSMPDFSGLSNLQLLDVSQNPGLDLQEVPDWLYTMASIMTIKMDSAMLTGPLDARIFQLPVLQSLSLKNNSLNGSVTFEGNSASSLVAINLQNNDFTGVSGSPKVNGGPSVVIPGLAGNPYCTDPGTSGSKYCQQAASESVSNSWHTNKTCSPCGGGQTANLNDCSCGAPLVLSMQLTTPAFQTVNDSLVTSLRSEFAGFYGLDANQVFVDYANFTSDGRMLFTLSFFPKQGKLWNIIQVTNITNGLTPPVNHLSQGPYKINGDVQLYPYLAASSSKSGLGTGGIVGIVAGVLVALVIVGLIAAYAIRQKMRADNAETSRPFASWGASSGDPGEAPQLKGARWFTLAEVKKATNNFDGDNEVGVGGYGKVYKGVLPSGNLVAVKRAGAGSMQGATEFKNEIELLSRVHHKHLVGLVGFCYEGGEQVLVYEYIPNGTLRDHLLGHTEMPLPWGLRVAIALGSARGIAYLHEMANPPIIHRDIKSSNILLDEKMVAKVSDFGLSKLAPDADDTAHVSTQVKGTLGYLDPEYYMTNHLSEKSDVYSFGVVLLELLSARPPIERGRYIVREVRTALDKGGERALDPLLDPFLGNYPQKELSAILDLALHCVEEHGTERPTMDDVVKELEVIAGNSHPNSGVHITVEPQQKDDDPLRKGIAAEKSDDPSFQYSTDFVPGSVQPK